MNLDINGLGLIYSKDEAIKDSYFCPDCDERTMEVNSDFTLNLRKRRKAEALNTLRSVDVDNIYGFICYRCGYKLESDKIDSSYFRVNHKATDLREVAYQCDPYSGQTWAAKTGFPTETCPINGNPCLKALWDVCPHIGNLEMVKMLELNVPIVGEPE